jgi:transposase
VSPMSTKPKSNPNPKPPEIIELDAPAVAEIRQRIAARQLTERDYEIFTAILAAYCFLVNLLTSKRITIARLKKLLFGARTETTEAVLGSVANGTTLPAAGEDDRRDAANSPPSGAPPKRRKGHGRNGADDYRGAQRIVVPHESLQPDDNCLKCQDGTVYELPRPATLIRIVGQAPVQATIYELQRLRCKLCGAVFTAQVPEGVGPDKYDVTVASIIGLLKYGRGVPFYRLAGLQQDLGIPLPAATQWKVAHEAVPSFEPAYLELIRQAACGEVVYHDDTNNRILELMGKRWAKAQAQEAARAAEREAGEEAPPDPDPSSERRGIFTSGIVSTCAGQRIALFFTGRKHAGENLRDVLAQRAKQLAPPIQMCDPLSRNMPAELNTILANCLAHGRRQFVDVVEHFPDECRYVLEALKVVYQNDAVARQKQLSPEARLQFHKSQSGPVMDDLQAWLQRQIEDHLVEPNSGLGEAITYMLKRWDKFTLFLRQAGAPLDNNLCERALKKVILHRKNAMFYKTENGAHTGDIYMSLIYTCELCGANPFDYLTELQRHAQEVAANPASWMPWNYRETLAVVPAATSPPATATSTPWTTVP